MVEMLITISIIGILSAIGISVYKGVTGNAEVAIAGDFVESLNRGLHEYEQTNQTINVESNANSTDDELQIVKELQKTDVDAFGSPYFNPDWKPTASLKCEMLQC